MKRILALSGLLLALPAGAGAAVPQLSVAAHGSVVQAQVTDAPGCVLTATAGKRRTVRHLAIGSGQLSLRVRATNRLSLRCGSVQWKGRLSSGRQISRPAITARVLSALPATPAAPSLPATQLPAAQEQQAHDAVEQMLAQILASDQCTALVLKARPELYRVAETPLVRAQVAAGDAQLHSRVWDARYMADYAAAAGFGISDIPSVGAVMVEQPGVDGAGAYGHVGLVTRVNPNGSYVIAERNADSDGRDDSRRLAAGVVVGRSFIL